MPDDSNGWRTGRDPALRWLRIGAVMVLLGVFSLLALDPTRNDPVTLGLSLGAAMILLGYEGLIRLPGIGRDSGK